MKERFVRRFARIVAPLIAISLLCQGCFQPDSPNFSLDVPYTTSRPADDRAIEQWLKARPGVKSASVTRMSGSIAFKVVSAQSPKLKFLMEIMNECERLGYKDRKDYTGSLFDPLQRGTYHQTLWLEFGFLPGDDQELISWLSQVQGVAAPHVSRDGKLIALDYELSHDPSHPAPAMLFSDIMKKCESLGYREQQGYIHAFGRY